MGNVESLNRSDISNTSRINGNTYFGIMEINPAKDPIELFKEWLADAYTTELNDPDAVALATVGIDARPSVRMVLLKSIDQARAIHKGKLKPGRVIEFSPLKIKKIRAKLKVSQPEFAHMIGISIATLQNWEQGRTYPEGAARALLKVAEKRPEAVLDALHLS